MCAFCLAPSLKRSISRVINKIIRFGPDVMDRLQNYRN